VYRRREALIGEADLGRRRKRISIYGGELFMLNC